MAEARPPLRPLDQALAELLANARPALAPEQISTFEADGRVLAEDLVSELTVPPHDNSSMDGYAVRIADLTGAAKSGAALPVSQRIPAGAAAEPLAPGSAARIFTGAPLPPGADAVVMQEQASAEQGGTRVRITAAVEAGQNIRRAGEDVAKGAVVLPRGTRLGPAASGLAAGIGFDRLRVAQRPKVALFSTGDELVMPGEVAPADMRPGSIYNSNRYFLRALLLRMGCSVSDFGIVPDRLDATTAALQQAGATHDLILTSGGVSVGEEDHVRTAVQALGQLHLWQLAIKPGKPFAYGRVGSAHFCGLPGNPVSSFVTFLLLVRPFLLRLQGATVVAPVVLRLPAHFNWPRGDPRREFLRASRNVEGGLDLYPNQSSGVLTSTVWADGLVDNPPGGTIARGDPVSYIAFSDLFG